MEKRCGSYRLTHWPTKARSTEHRLLMMSRRSILQRRWRIVLLGTWVASRKLQLRSDILLVRFRVLDCSRKRTRLGISLLLLLLVLLPLRLVRVAFRGKIFLVQFRIMITASSNTRGRARFVDKRVRVMTMMRLVGLLERRVTLGRCFAD